MMEVVPNRVVAKIWLPTNNVIEFDLYHLSENRIMEIVELLEAAAIDPLGEEFLCSK